MWNDVTPVAMKKLKSQDQFKEFASEAAMLQCLTHPNIVQFFGIYSEHTDKYLVTELLSKGNLQTLLMEEGESLSVLELVGMANECAAGMFYLHQQNVLHRDLALRKISPFVQPAKNL